MGSFAYIHCKPDDTPFYVGKGALRRAKYFGERNPHHKNIVAKYGSKNLSYVAMECSDDATAYLLEQGLIKCLLRSGAKLVNLTAGGDGGRNPSEETRAKMSAAAKIRGVSAACHEAKVKAKRGVPLSQAQRDKQRDKMLGKVFSEEHRNNISVSAKKRGMSPRTLAAAWAAPRKKRAVYVDGVFYPSLKAASSATGLYQSGLIYALRHSGVCKGHTVTAAAAHDN